MTTFTLIAYRPNYDEYHCGKRYDSSDSDFEIIVSESLDVIVMHTVDYNFNEKSKHYNSAYAAWELTLLIDGKKESWQNNELNHEHLTLREIYDDKVKEGIAIRKQEIIEAKKKAEEEKRIQTEKETLVRKQREQEYKIKQYNLLKQELGF